MHVPKINSIWYAYLICVMCYYTCLKLKSSRRIPFRAHSSLLIMCKVCVKSLALGSTYTHVVSQSARWIGYGATSAIMAVLLKSN